MIPIPLTTSLSIPPQEVTTQTIVGKGEADGAQR